MRLAFWKKPPEQRNIDDLYRAATELIVANAPYVAHGSSQPSPTNLMKSMTGASAIAARAIADRVSSLEMQVVATRRVMKGTTEDEILDDHPLKRLLDNPSEWHSARQLKRLIAHQLVAIGESYLLKITGGGPFVNRLQLLPPDQIQPLGDGRTITGYELTSRMGQRIEVLDPMEVCRIWNPDPEAVFHARGVLGPQARLSDMLEFSEQHLRTFYEMDASPNVVFEANESSAQAPTQDVLERFMAKWIGHYNSRKGTKRGVPPFIAPGWQAKVLDVASTLAGTREIMEYGRDSILMAYGVPRSIVGDVVDANRAAAETNAYVFDRHTVLPITEAIADALTHGLATLYPQRPGVTLSVRFEDFVMDDKDFELACEKQDLQLKVRSVNMVREDKGLDPVAWGDIPVGTWSDRPYDGSEEPDLPMDDASALGDTEAAAAEQSAEAAADPRPGRSRSRDRKEEAWRRFVQTERKFVPILQARVRRVFDRQEKVVQANLADQFRARASFSDLLGPDEDWEREFKRIVDPVRQRVFLEAAVAALLAAGATDAISFVFTESVRNFLEIEGARLVQQTTRTTQKRIAAALLEGTAEGEALGQLAKRIRGVFDERRKNHARTIARTEVLKASQKAQIEGFKQAGEAMGFVVRKRWNTALDENVRDAHEYAQNQVRALAEPFELKDGPEVEYADGPGIGSDGRPLSAGNAINCRCFLTTVFPDE